MDVPGNLGYSFFGDKSLGFVRSPLDFIARRRETYGDVFKARILNTPHIFLTSSKAVHELLWCKIWGLAIYKVIGLSLLSLSYIDLIF